jgi:hypothetical protein
MLRSQELNVISIVIFIFFFSNVRMMKAIDMLKMVVDRGVTLGSRMRNEEKKKERKKNEKQGGMK